MVWEPYALAVVFGLIVSGTIYFIVMWPQVAPDDDDDDDDDAAADADDDAALARTGIDGPGLDAAASDTAADDAGSTASAAS